MDQGGLVWAPPPAARCPQCTRLWCREARNEKEGERGLCYAAADTAMRPQRAGKIHSRRGRSPGGSSQPATGPVPSFASTFVRRASPFLHTPAPGPRVLNSRKSSPRIPAASAPRACPPLQTPAPTQLHPAITCDNNRAPHERQLLHARPCCSPGAPGVDQRGRDEAEVRCSTAEVAVWPGVRMLVTAALCLSL